MADASLIRCPACSAMNRVPADKIFQGLAPVCGRCKSHLPIGRVLTVTDANFSAEVEQSSLPVLVDMWAEWCGPCRAIAPIVEQLATEMAGRARIAKMNVDENPLTAGRFRIQSIPALLVFKDGVEVDRIVGAQPKSAIASRLERVLA